MAKLSAPAPYERTNEMQFVTESTVELVAAAGSDEMVLNAMLVSTKKDQVALDPKADAGRINFLMKNRHGTPFEHNMMTFRVHAPLAVFREWHRHRIGWSYNETSGRYTKFDPVFYMPAPDRPLVQQGKPGEYRFVAGSVEQYSNVRHSVRYVCEKAWEAYERLLEEGIAKEVARGVLPVYLMSTMYATCNARSLMSFLSLRRKLHVEYALFPSFPMYEIDVCALAMEREFSRLFPITHKAYIENGRVAP